jgi:hypothetical protein
MGDLEVDRIDMEHTIQVVASIQIWVNIKFM